MISTHLKEQDYPLTNTLIALKMKIVSIPCIEKMIEGSYEKVFRSKTMSEMYFNFAPLVWKFFRNPSVPNSDKFQLFRFLWSSITEDDLVDKSFGFQFNPLKVINLTIFSNESYFNINESPSQKEIEMFNGFINSIKMFDQQQIVPIEQMIDPTYFNPLLNNTPSEFEQKKNLKRKIIEMFSKATPEQLGVYVQFLSNDSNWNGWDFSFDISTLSLEELNQFIEHFNN
ncbi:hypothetical protein QTN25_007905 [Entamoeba marina]